MRWSDAPGSRWAPSARFALICCIATILLAFPGTRVYHVFHAAPQHFMFNGLQTYPLEHCMNQAAEQFLASATTAVNDLNTMATTALAGFEKLVELNLATAKSALADTAEQMQAGFAVKAPQDVAAMAQPMADKAAAYGRAVASIVTETGSALSKAAEAKFADVQAQAVANIEAAMKHAPAGSESAVAAFKNALTTGQTALATVQAQAKQAVDTVGKNFDTAAEMAAKAGKTVTKAR